MSASKETSVNIPFRNLELPPELDDDPDHQYFVDFINWLPEYELSNDRFKITDPVWGEETIGNDKHDRVLLELAKHPALLRLFDVEQLTLPRNYTTIPNTALFKRWEHVWGSVVFVRQMARKSGISERDSMVLQLRTLLSDAGHTTGSHLGDWNFQDKIEENLHEKELRSYLDRVEVNNILRYFKFDPNEVLDVSSKGWVGADSPSLSEDRLDYGLREIKRWIPYSKELHTITSEDFELDENQELYMKDITKAKAFAEAYLELSREHWSDPIHRLQLSLYIIRAKRIHTVGLAHNDHWVDYHPRDLMYCSDRQYSQAMLMRDSFGSALNELLSDIAKQERMLGWQARRFRVAKRLGNTTYAYDDPLAHSDLARHYLSISVEPEEEFEESAESINLPLLGTKLRQVDPKVMTEDGIKKLSEIDAEFELALTIHKKEMATNYIAKIGIPDAILRAEIEEEIIKTNNAWDNLMTKPRMPADVLKGFVREAGSYSSVGKGLIKLDLS